MKVTGWLFFGGRVGGDEREGKVYLNAAKIKKKKKAALFFLTFEIVRGTQPSLTRCAVYLGLA
jgi:hypothetical protein